MPWLLLYNFVTARWLIKSNHREATGSTEKNSSRKDFSTRKGKFSGMSTSSHSLLVRIFSTLVSDRELWTQPPIYSSNGKIWNRFELNWIAEKRQCLEKWYFSLSLSCYNFWANQNVQGRGSAWERVFFTFTFLLQLLNQSKPTPK